jgi:renal tumor antigen
VLKAQSIKTGKYVAIKCMKNHFTSIEQVNNLREIQALRRLSPHPHIVKLVEILYDEPTGRLALVFELMDLNLYEWIRGRRHYLPENKVKFYMYQLVKSMEHMHRNGIFHRDIKPENVLLVDDSLKLADFGSCRGIYSKQPYTEYISTRWYRAPECLLTDGYYDYKMDIWGVGCVFFEVLALFPLFPGKNELDQVHKIHNILGTPTPELLQTFKDKASHMDFNFPPKEGTGIDKLIPHVSAEARALIGQMLTYKAEDRISARQALKDPYFRELREAERPLNSLNPSEADNAGGNEEAKTEKRSEASEKTATSLPPIKTLGYQTKASNYLSEKRIKINPSSKSIAEKKPGPYVHAPKKSYEVKKHMVSPYKRSLNKIYY